MSVLDGPGEGTWSVFAQKVVEQRDALRYAISEAIKEVLCTESPGCTGCMDSGYQHKNTCSTTNALEILRNALKEGESNAQAD